MIHAIGFSTNGYIKEIGDLSSFVSIYLRRLAYSGVPLFLMLSGSLNKDKISIIEKYKKRFPQLSITYLFWAVMTAGFNVFFLNEKFGVHTILSIFDYSVQDRAWYMDMFLDW